MARRNHLFAPYSHDACAILVPRTVALAQDREVPGKSIGKVSVVGNLILMELDEGALGQQNLFDLGQHTLRFTPGSAGISRRKSSAALGRGLRPAAKRSSSRAAQLLISFFRQNLEFIFSRRYRIDSVQRGKQRVRRCAGPASDRAAMKAEFPLAVSIR